MKRQKIFHWAAVMAGVLYCGGACQQKAAGEEFTAVNWSGDYIPLGDITSPPTPPTYTYLNGHVGVDSLPSYVDPDTDIVAQTTGRIVNDVIAYNPQSTNYLAPPRLSSVFYGGHTVQWATSTGNPGFNDLQVENKTPFVSGDTADYMHLSVLPDPSLTRYDALFYWKKDDFANGFSSPGNLVTLTDNNTFLLNVVPTTPVSPPVDKELIRWVVRNNADFYISRTIEKIPTNTLDAFAITKVKDITWESWNPLGGGLSDIFFASGTTALTSSLTNITALGFYLSSEDGDNTNNSMNMLIKQFAVTANANVPEPGFAVVGLFGVGLFAVRQLKSRRSRSSAIPAEDFQAVS
jgi:hypothetical protein